MGEAYDVLVLGGGAAGVSAALAAAASGCRTVLVRSAPGATALSAGGWRGGLPEGLAAALRGAGLPHEAIGGPLPHPAGDLVAYDTAAPAQRDAAVEAEALVCGIVGLPGYRARGLARLWGAAAGVELAWAMVDAGSTPAAGWSPAALAAALDREPGHLAEAVARAVREAGARRVVLPAVLGLGRADAVRAAVAAAAGVPAAESLGVPPSLPGWRLDRALGRAVEAAGVAVAEGRVVGREASGRRVAAVLVRPAGGGPPVRLAAGQVVLATGKFAAGGLAAGGLREGDNPSEPALGCPVWVEHLGGWFDLAQSLALTRPERALPQPLLAAGVRADAEGRPVDERGGVVYENVRVAGSIRAGIEAGAPGLGRAAEDGWRAGRRAAGEVA